MYINTYCFTHAPWSYCVSLIKRTRGYFRPQGHMIVFYIALRDCRAFCFASLLFVRYTRYTRSPVNVVMQKARYADQARSTANSLTYILGLRYNSMPPTRGLCDF